MDRTIEITIDGQTYVAIPKARYLEMQGLPSGTAPAAAFAREHIARGLVEARTAARLTQTLLAKRLAVSQSMVANAEAGRTKVSARYVARVLKACGLPKDWASP